MKGRAIAAAAVGAALIFGAGWAANGWRLGQEIAQLQLAHTQELAARDTGAFLAAQAIDTNYQGALNASIQEQGRLAGAAAVATRNAGRLRAKSSKQMNASPRLPPTLSESTLQPQTSYSDSAARDHRAGCKS